LDKSDFQQIIDTSNTRRLLGVGLNSRFLVFAFYDLLVARTFAQALELLLEARQFLIREVFEVP
jgi:hypothetical protein